MNTQSFVKSRHGVTFDKDLVREKAVVYKRLSAEAEHDHGIYRSPEYKELYRFFAILNWTLPTVCQFLHDEAQARLDYYNSILHPQCIEV